jgi:hypothetical protein
MRDQGTPIQLNHALAFLLRLFSLRRGRSPWRLQCRPVLQSGPLHTGRSRRIGLPLHARRLLRLRLLLLLRLLLSWPIRLSRRR